MTREEVVRYHAWYATPRGAWMAACELALLRDLLHPEPEERLLDVGCGTGFFSSQFADWGLHVTGLDPDSARLDFARQHDQRIDWLVGQAETLPFADAQFDYAAAITSLCFVARPAQALQELWRVSRRAVILGLLHRHSLLWWHKRHALGYRGARWDTLADVRTWAKALQPAPQLAWRYGIFEPSASGFAQIVESRLSPRLPLGGFLAVAWRRT